MPSQYAQCAAHCGTGCGQSVEYQGNHASVVLCSIDEGIMISGRSLGNINMQVILEKLGGGGHLTMAGAQLTNITMAEARQLGD
jgi:c-di-AMP phosphodiesterase-like protein